MTKEQQKLIEENHNVIYSVLNKLNVSVEDYYDIGAIGMCEAAINYDKNKNIEFPLYAFIQVKYAILNAKRYENQICRNTNSNIYGDTCILGTDTLNLWDTISKQEDSIEDLIIVRDYLYRLFEQLNDKEKEIAKLLILEDFSQAEISKIVGLSKQRVSIIVKNIKKKAHKIII